MKKGISFPVDDFAATRIKMLNWVNRFSIFSFLDNCAYDFSKPAFECLVAAGAKQSVTGCASHALDSLHVFQEAHPSEWLFGHLGYDLLADSPKQQPAPVDGIGFEDLFFFIPEVLLQLDKESLTIHADTDAASIHHSILACPSTIATVPAPPVIIQQRIPREAYICIIKELKEHILRGDCYEINFCQEFYAEGVAFDPLSAYHKLTSLSPNPFSAFYRLNDRYCCCASPERYLSRTGNRICSQPIKGTAKRTPGDPEQDEAGRQYLLTSTKEKSENVMVVDLVRNDLSRVCIAGTVQVDELFGLYRFPHVYQMISTVSGELKPGISNTEVLKASFPMGSMTGAPKIRVMELIKEYEKTRRGLFSGAIGYFKPVKDGSRDFDLNVVIRSMLYNSASRYLSFQTGSGITFYCEPEQEYEECLLKASAMLAILK